MSRDLASDRLDSGSMREAAFASAIVPRYVHARRGHDHDYDFLSLDGRQAIELKFALHGVRDLNAVAVQLALALATQPELERLILVAYVGRISVGRVETEWTRVLAALRPELAARLALVALGVEGDVSVPRGDAELEWLVQRARALRVPHPPQRPHDTTPAPWTEKTFDVWTVLLEAWLRREPPLPIGEIETRSQCSYPTVAATVQQLESRGELSRTSSRRAGFTSLPRGSLGEILVMADHLRGTQRYVDGSGQRPDPEGLVRRIRAKAPTAVAIGGVVAARHYVPDFDLNGLPRIDVTTQARNSGSGWVSGLDPALRLATPQERSPVLVVHHTRRAAPFYDADRRVTGALVGPAETLLDLYDLRLTEQADDFARSLRGKGDARG